MIADGEKQHQYANFDGAPGRFLVNGKPVSEGKKITMQPGDVVVLETPGGGGYGHI